MVILDDCCGFPLKKGTITIGVVFLIGGLLGSVGAASRLSKASEDWVTVHAPLVYAIICCGIIDAILATFLIVVAIKENAVLVLSWIFVEIPMFIIIVVLKRILLYTSPTGLEIFDSKFIVVSIVICSVIVAVLIYGYFLLVVYSYYQSLRERDGRT